MVVTLIGYRGCGKSSVGPLLARQLGCDCVDSDDQIEARAGKSIREIFATDGVDEFRRLETEVLTDLIAQDNIVIAAGGGAILAEVNRQRIQAAGPVVWLRATVETLAARICGDGTTADRRPSLTGKSVEVEVAEVLKARLPLYESTSSIIVDSDMATPQELADEIFSRLPSDAAEGKR
ncbi:shikimate kinase [Fuerstiella marisgermanici]|uniref:Shikimate kinase n=1 Tax=Fuerstiella marisgermanici TaxID=1891926 RepID=A0A1P8WS20_9PLAN|nr:shikimate kinase [Fuerstiella marisgermanici]APZ96856.1 Shikimate kinase 2 [Fuerstiella marisgermanici]